MPQTLLRNSPAQRSLGRRDCGEFLPVSRAALALCRLRSVLAAVALLAGSTVHAQGVVTQKNLSLDLAKTIAEAALGECRAKGFHTSVAVVDRAGQVLVLLRDEQATATTLEMAQRKAYTARMFRMSTADFQKRTTPDQPYAGQRDVNGMLALSGGVPIRIGGEGGEVIGGVGSSGSSLTQDDECAKAGVAKVADLLK